MSTVIIDWDAEAIKAASYVSEHRQAEQHGAIPWGARGHAAIYSNDGFQNNEAAQITVGLLRQMLETLEIRVLGFGLTSDGESWAMIVTSDESSQLSDALGAAWKIASENDPDVLEARLMKSLQQAVDEAPPPPEEPAHDTPPAGR